MTEVSRVGAADLMQALESWRVLHSVGKSNIAWVPPSIRYLSIKLISRVSVSVLEATDWHVHLHHHHQFSTDDVCIYATVTHPNDRPLMTLMTLTICDR